MLRRIQVVLILLLGATLSFPSHGFSQQQDQAQRRKVISKVSPEYPNMARNMNLRGTVKVEAVVSTDGIPKTVEIKGGHPVLAQAAVFAVRKWKWEKSPHDSTEVIEVNFSPEY